MVKNGPKDNNDLPQMRREKTLNHQGTKYTIEPFILCVSRSDIVPWRFVKLIYSNTMRKTKIFAGARTWQKS